MTEKKKPDVMETALKKLARRSMAEAEMRDFLRRKGASEEELEPVIRELRDLGYLNDKEYCRMYFDHAFRKNKSRRLVFLELEEKGVADEVIAAAYRDYQDEGAAPDEAELAEKEARRMLREAGLTENDPVPEKIRGRIARKLYSRGFTESLIYDVLDDLKR